MILLHIHRLLTLAPSFFLLIVLGSLSSLQAKVSKLDSKDNLLTLDMNNLPKNGLMPMPTEEEMREIEKFLSTLSDSEIEELIRYGENITKIAEENNIPLFFEPPAIDSATSKPLPPPLPTKNDLSDTKPKDKITPPVLITKDDIAYYKKTLEDLLWIIQTLRQRITSVKKFKTTFQDLVTEIELLVYYLHVLQKENIMLHLKDKKYEGLVTLMIKNTTILTDLNHTLELPSLDALYAHPFTSTTQKQLKNAEKIITTIKKTFEAMLHQEGLITTIETLLKEYEPIALQIKQKNEEKEKAAHESVKKIPVTNIAKPIPVTPAYSQPYQGPRANAPITPPIKNPTPQKPQTPPTSADQKLKTVEPIKKQDAAKKAKSATIAELEREIINIFDSIEQRLVPQRAHINDFLTTYSTAKTEPELVTSALNDANFGLKKAKTLVEDWYKKLEKEATSKTDMENKAKNLRETFKNNVRHTNLKTIHAKTKGIPKNTAEGSVKRFKEMMDSIEKRIIDIF